MDPDNGATGNRVSEADTIARERGLTRAQYEALLQAIQFMRRSPGGEARRWHACIVRHWHFVEHPAYLCLSNNHPPPRLYQLTVATFSELARLLSS